ncbi:MAG: sigma-E processing peptidase SpoIIGA [Clostridia bacterium]
MTIYLDVVLFENICMNYIILFATGVINKSKIKHIRLFLSSLMGGVYAVFSYMVMPKVYASLTLKILLSVTMIYLAFSPKNVKSLFKYLILFYLTSFAFGGCAFALLYFIRPQDIFMKNGVFIGTYPIKIALLRRNSRIYGYCDCI